ncbi:MAG TPA: glycosyltransferase [Flavobacteriales bacterium]|nr:glycosyltransferase [Flavobacteriales bacterium]
MVSILVPIYNTDVRSFIKELLEQLQTNAVEGEVLCIDDCSPLEEIKVLNRQLSALEGVTYLELDENIGRSKIRNLLAKSATHNWLLFVDGDSSVSEGLYLKNYLLQINNTKQVCYGGTSYGSKPTNKELYLHWFYGSQREIVPIAKRKANPFGTFKTNNFFAHKSIFERMQFNESLKGYGHEDTLFAKDLERNGFTILHMENPLQHDGLEVNTLFLAKQYNAIKNLAELYKQGLVGNEIRLINFYNKIKKTGMGFLVKRFYLRDQDLLKENLLSDKPKLTNLDRLKLGWFVSMIND